MRGSRALAGALVAASLGMGARAGAAPAAPTLKALLGYTFVSDLVGAERADRIAWVQDENGVRNVWVADAGGSNARPVTRYTGDDGQEITGLAWSPDGGRLVYVRGGDHDANWPADGKLAPDPSADPQEPKVTIWAASLTGAAPVKVAEGDFPAISARGRLAYIKDDQVWTAALDGSGHAERLLFDRGKDGQLAWSPDGSRLAFTSDRGDHAFIAVWSDRDHPLTYLAPSTGQDELPAWSPDGRRIAFTRRPGQGGAPEPLLTRVPHPWAIWTADATSGAGQRVWASPSTLDGSYPGELTGVNLLWAADGRLAFTADLDGWRHLYSVSAKGGEPALLTPGRFDVEDLTLTRDRGSVVYNADTGPEREDSDRRHLFKVALAGGAPVELTAGSGSETAPAIAGPDRVAYVSWGVRRPAAVATAPLDPAHPQTGDARSALIAGADAAALAYPAADLVAPRLVSFTAPDGLTLQGQLFEAPGGAARKPGVVFVHGGPPRQMLLDWHYMGYYSNAYALNQYLATHGFVVLSVNYRLGIGYGRAFRQPDHAGYAGSSEYQDVLAAGRFLAAQPGVEPGHIGIWGGSYGGLMTALALGRNSDLFKAGVDFHGVHDWSADLNDWVGPAGKRYEQGDRSEAMRVAFESSPVAAVKTWRSPVLLIQGDDDRNVHFSEMIDLSRRLDAQGVRHEELVIPDEIHGFLRRADWRLADEASAAFLTRELGAR